ncbi:sacsin N-terminal ATP-binding-like domain-containing protein [Enterococcus faecalis]|uniref:sacsin N-terminal ATP-binding-like domain-containing protein n=1 Tax=Enterococcus faecalis TaxID=1351 RepID=UPI003D771FBA
MGRMIFMPAQSENIKDEFLKKKSAATIHAEMNKLRMSSGEQKEKLRQRWIWELIQNAVDCCRDNEMVDIEIIFEGESTLTFSHNGKGFRELDLWSIVTQTSSKQGDEESTGQFGTGFVTTSLLSPKISIYSFLEDTKESFNLTIDRSGTTITEIIETVEENFNTLNRLFDENNFKNEIGNKTSFQYDLNISPEHGVAKEAVLIGLQSLYSHLPYVLSFSEKIRSIKINNKIFKLETPIVVDIFENTQINIVTNNIDDEKWAIILHSFAHGSFAAPILFDSEYKFIEISEKIAKLSCTFPLIGTEGFPFPLILNSSFFEVEIDRNAIFESSEKNKLIINEAMQEYDKLLDVYGRFSEVDVSYICHFNAKDLNGFKHEIKNRLNQIILNKNMVPSSKGSLVSILDEDGDKQVAVPNAIKKEYLSNVWSLLSKVPNLIVPSESKMELWRNIVNNDLTITKILIDHISNKSVSDFKEWFGEENIFEWLNQYYELLAVSSKGDLNRIEFPNMLERFVSLTTLSFFEGSFYQLIELLLLIDVNKQKEFVMSEVCVPEIFKAEMNTYRDSDAAKQIEDYVISLLAREKADTGNPRTPEVEILFNEILQFFLNYPVDSAKLFPTLYVDRAKLRAENYAEELNQFGDFLSENGLPMDKVRDLLSQQELIDTILNEADLSPEVISTLKHKSISSPEYAQRVKKMIERSTKRVYEELLTNSRYTVPLTFESWQSNRLSSTVFKAEKDMEQMIIVVRPSDGDKIIFYEDTEISALSSEKFELWTDNGIEVVSVTLGDLLRTTNITVIPLRNLFGGE